jgi:hypothetical protein
MRNKFSIPKMFDEEIADSQFMQSLYDIPQTSKSKTLIYSPDLLPLIGICLVLGLYVNEINIYVSTISNQLNYSLDIIERLSNVPGLEFFQLDSIINFLSIEKNVPLIYNNGNLPY